MNEKSPADPNLKNINAYIDEKLVGSLVAKFLTRGFGGVLAENGFNNVAEFRNFDIAPIVPNLLGIHPQAFNKILYIVFYNEKQNFNL